MPTFNNGEGLDSVRTKINAAIEKVDGTSPITSADINGGTIDGTVIGGTTPAAVTATSLTATGTTTLAGASTTADITFGDNDKAIFGAGSDLRIYHDSSNGNSYIEENGTGDLRILANNIWLADYSGQKQLTTTANAETKLYYNGSPKLATTSTGVDVTGTVVSDGLTVDGAGDFVGVSGVQLKRNLTPGGAGSGANLLNWQLVSTGSTYVTGASIQGISDGAWSATSAPMFLSMRTVENGTTTLKERMRISNNGDISFYEDTGTTPKFFWDASAEALGIGTSSPTSIGGYTALSVDNAGTGSLIDSYQGGTIYGRIRALSNQYAVLAQGASTPLLLGTNNTERMRIDASGNLLVGKTAADNTTAGGSIFAGVSSFVNDGARALTLVRNTSDGDIVEFRKGGTTVGSIGVKDLGGAMGPRLYLGNTDTGLFFQGETNNAITPCQGDSGATLDNSISLGSSSARFKDLYLSGGVYLGGTGAANKLDDYEEGTWTPDVVGTATAGTGTYAVRTGKYTKVGNLVTVFGSYDLTAHTGSGDLRIDGLPFTAANESNLYTIGQWSSNNLTLDAIAVQVYVFSNTNTDYLTVSQVRNAASNLPVVLDAAHAAWFSISYYV